MNVYSHFSYKVYNESGTMIYWINDKYLACRYADKYSMREKQECKVYYAEKLFAVYFDGYCTFCENEEIREKLWNE